MNTKLFKNIGFLSLSQAANYVLPLITIPYITRVVGPDNYGLIEFATVSMLYFSAIVVYGFKTTATRKIAEYPNDIAKVSKIFSTVVSTKLLLFLLTLFVFVGCLVFIPKFQEYQKVLLFAFPITLGWALYPDFLFQGLQKLQFIAIANFLIKAVAAGLIFILLKKPEDYYVVLGINAASQLIVGLGILIVSFKVIKGLQFKVPSIKFLGQELKEGIYIFLSLFFTRIYTFGSIIFLTFLLSEYELGLYSAAMKLITVAVSFLFLPLSGALFPFLANKLKENPKSYWPSIKKAGGVMLLISTLSMGILILIPSIFIKVVFGSKYLEAIPLLQIMAPVILLTAISHFCMQQGLIIFKKDKTYLNIILFAGILSLGLNYVFITQWGMYGATYVKVLVELFLVVTSGYYFYLTLKEKQFI